MSFRRSRNVVFRRILDEHMLVPIRGQVADMQRVFALNAVGAFIWEVLDEARDEAGLAARVVQAFAVDQETAAADVRNFLAELQREGLIEAAG